MFKFLYKVFFAPHITRYTLPTLRITFLNGRKITVEPAHYHRNYLTEKDEPWNYFYCDDGFLFGRYPLVSIQEVVVVSEKAREVAHRCDPLFLPARIHKDELPSGAKLVYRKRKGVQIAEG